MKVLKALPILPLLVPMQKKMDNLKKFLDREVKGDERIILAVVSFVLAIKKMIETLK